MHRPLRFVLMTALLAAAALPARADANADLIMAAYRGDRTLARSLVSRGAKLDARDENGYTALHWAAYNGDVRMLTMLLDLGAGLEPRDGKGNTPLMLASWMGRSQCVRVLLQRGADRNAKSPEGYTPMDFARARHQEAVMRELATLAIVRHPLPSPSPRVRLTPHPTPRPTPHARPTRVPTPEPNEEPASEPSEAPMANEPTPEPTGAPEEGTEASPTPPPAPAGPPGNTVEIVSGVHLSKIDFPIVGVRYRRALFGPLALQLGYELGGYTQPVGTGTVDFNFSRLHAGLVTTGWVYGGLGYTRIVLGSLYASGFNPAANSYELILGGRYPVGAFSFGLEGRLAYEGPSTALFAAGASF